MLPELIDILGRMWYNTTVVLSFKTPLDFSKKIGRENMTQGDLGKWADLQGCQNLLFFSQLVNELLFDYSIPSNRISTLNSHYLCLDALSAIEGIDEKGVPEGTLAPIVEELYTALKLDPIFIDVSPSPLDYFVKLEKTNYRISCNVSELNYIEKKNAVESVFTVFFSNGNYYRELKNKIVEKGLFTLTDLVKAIAEDKEDKTVGDLMSTNVVIVDEDLKIANAIEVMLKKSISRLIIADRDNNLLGIVTRTDLIDCITNLKQFPIITN